jgi:hypothetical protein
MMAFMVLPHKGLSKLMTKINTRSRTLTPERCEQREIPIRDRALGNIVGFRG